MTIDQAANLPVAADQHLADACLHLKRALLEIKNAATADPTLVVRLGGKHATLQDVLAELEGVR